MQVQRQKKRTDTEIEVIFEGRTLPGEKEIQDDLVPYGTHAYRVSLC